MTEIKRHKFWWLWLPITVGIAQIILELTLPSGVLAELHSETGPHEFFEFILMFAGLIVALLTLKKLDIPDNKLLAGWLGLAALSCFYVAGEEVSWGQHFMNWSTPEYWLHINDQGETNLHNTSSWLDQKPRLILELGVLVGGLIIPLLLRFKPKTLPQQFAIFYPTVQFIPLAIMIFTVKMSEKVAEVMDVTLFERASEIEELYIFYFVLLYLIVLRRRVLQQQ
ncbi:hypothetical protein N9Z27_02610 [Alphaproteobacteria bacterium]|nr:hypothetical protein [Alphaproteobacteria bacterium]